MSRKCATIIVGLIATLVVSARPGHAEDGLLVMGGNAEEHQRATVGGAIENAIRGAGWTLAKPPNKKESDGLLKCPDSKSPWTCIPASFTKKGIRSAFVISVDLIQN